MPRHATPLTDSVIKAAKPRIKTYKLTDGEGLYLEITPVGSKLWRMRYRYQGKEKKLSFGAYPALSLAQARQRRASARELLAQEIDPMERKKNDQAAKKVGLVTFEQLAWEWYEHKSPRWAESTAKKAKLYLKNEIIPAIGLTPAAKITRPQLVVFVQAVEGRGVLNVAGKIRQWLKQIFSYGLAKGTVESNPATDLNIVALPAPVARNHPFVSLNLLPELLLKLDGAKIHILTRHAIRLLILTAARPGELRAAPWSEFDLDEAVWTIPKERMKARRPHIIPLPRQAVLMLRQLHEITGSYALVFAGQQNPERPMSENTVNKALKLMGYEGQQTGHGFRHLLSTELNGRGYNRDWIERQLAHGDKDDIRHTYNHATYLDKRREMMQDWADSIDELCAGGNVVPIRAWQG